MRLLLDLTYAAKVSATKVAEVESIMRSSVAVWAECNHEPGIIWPTVTKPVYVMRLKVTPPAHPPERSLLIAPFTVVTSPAEHIISHGLTSREGVCRGLIRLRLGVARLYRSPPQFCEIYAAIDTFALKMLDDRRQRPQVENEGTSQVPFCVRCLYFAYRFADHLIDKAELSAGDCLEQEQTSTVLRVIGNRLIPASHLHWTGSPHPEVREKAVLLPPVCIAMFQTAAPRYQKDNIVLSRRYDAWTGLPAILAVNINGATISFPALKPPSHRATPRFPAPKADHNEIAPSWRTAA